MLSTIQRKHVLTCKNLCVMLKETKTVKRIIQTRLQKIIGYMPDIADYELKKFWDTFKDKRVELKPEDWVSVYSAAKNSALSRHIVNRLADDNLVRRNEEGKIALPDVMMIDRLLNYFEAAKRVELIKETDITGQKKYLMVDFHANNAKKSIPQYQVELLLGMVKDFAEFYPELVNKGS